MNSRLHDIGSPDAYMDAKIHYFHLGSTGQGPLEATRYLGFQRIDSLPAPWPQRSAPMMVYALFSSALNPKSPQQRTIPYFRDTLVPTTERMRSLVRATHNASAAAWPEDYTLPSTWPAMQNVLVPNMRYIKAHRGMLHEPCIITLLGSPTWQRSRLSLCKTSNGATCSRLTRLSLDPESSLLSSRPRAPIAPACASYLPTPALTPLGRHWSGCRSLRTSTSDQRSRTRSS